MVQDTVSLNLSFKIKRKAIYGDKYRLWTGTIASLGNSPLDVLKFLT